MVRNPAVHMKREWKKFLYNNLNPLVEINFFVKTTGGTTGRFGQTTGGLEERKPLSKKAHAVNIKQASRTLLESGVFTESSFVFYFDRDDEEIRFDLWEDVHIVYQGIKYFVDPVKLRKAASHIASLG